MGELSQGPDSILYRKEEKKNPTQNLTKIYHTAVLERLTLRKPDLPENKPQSD